MNYRRSMWRVLFKTLPYYPANLSMRINPFPDKLCASCQQEVSFYPFPNDMELVASQPHVRPRPGNRVLLAFRVKDDDAPGFHRTDVRMIVENANSGFLCASSWREEHNTK